MDYIDGNVEEEKEEEFIVAHVDDIVVDVGKVKVDEVEETGTDRKESSMW